MTSNKVIGLVVLILIGLALLWLLKTFLVFFIDHWILTSVGLLVLIVIAVAAARSDET